MKAGWLTIEPGALLLAGLTALNGYLTHRLLEMFTGEQPGMSLPLHTVVFTVSLLGGTLVHEAGHALVGRLRGFQLVELVVRSRGMAVFLERSAPRTSTDQALISLAGPVAGLLCAVTLALAAGALPGLAPGLMFGAVFLGLTSLANLLLPMRGSDADKLYRVTWAVMRGRGHLPYMSSTHTA